MAKVSKIIWIEEDDGTISLNSIPGITQREIFQATFIITDKGRILKSRFVPTNQIVPSFDLVKEAVKPPVKTSKTIYRSIYDL